MYEHKGTFFNNIKETFLISFRALLQVLGGQKSDLLCLKASTL